jgi:hypothetical protein
MQLGQIVALNPILPGKWSAVPRCATMKKLLYDTLPADFSLGRELVVVETQLVASSLSLLE